ncbi:MAG: SGNH/GDSL hydrolase family protein [Pirellulales bacterium]
MVELLSLCLSYHGVATLVAAVALSLASTTAWAEVPEEHRRWLPAIEAFEAQDKESPPPREGVLFIGSSSIVGWDVARWFPDLPAINRGFGGSQFADSVYFADRILLPYRPKTVVLYAGDNDIAAGKPPEQVHDDFVEFTNAVHETLPQARIVFVAIKPSLSRWNLVEKMRDANRRIHTTTEKDDRLVFLDIDRPMIGADGRPRPELFKDDGLHLNEQGYELWSTLLRPHLVE